MKNFYSKNVKKNLILNLLTFAENHTMVCLNVTYQLGLVNGVHSTDVAGVSLLLLTHVDFAVLADELCFAFFAPVGLLRGVLSADFCMMRMHVICHFVLPGEIFSTYFTIVFCY